MPDPVVPDNQPLLRNKARLLKNNQALLGHKVTMFKVNFIRSRRHVNVDGFHFMQIAQSDWALLCAILTK